MTESKNTKETVRETAVLQLKGPEWIRPALARILELEIRLGNIIAEEKWQTADADELFERAAGMAEQDDFDESVVESLFRKVCRALRDEGHSPEEIAAYINTHIKTGSKLKYCDGTEVADALD